MTQPGFPKDLPIEAQIRTEDEADDIAEELPVEPDKGVPTPVGLPDA